MGINKKEMLKSIEIFRNFSAEAIEKLSSSLEEVRYAAGEIIFSEDDTADNLFIVVEGEVIISKKISPEAEKVLAVLGPKSIFGEMSLFVNLPRTANAKTKSETVCYKIQRENFRKIYSVDINGTTSTIELFLLSSLERLELTSRELATVYEISRIIVQDLSMQEFCQKVMKQICYSIPGSTSGTIYLFNQFSEEFAPVAKIENEKIIPATQEDTIDTSSPIISFLQTQNETLIGNNKVIIDFKNKYYRNIPDTHQLIISPLQKTTPSYSTKNNMVGFILLFNQELTQKQNASIRDLMNSISNLLLGAIENIETREENEAKKRLEKSKQTGSISW